MTILDTILELLIADPFFAVIVMSDQASDFDRLSVLR